MPWLQLHLYSDANSAEKIEDALLEVGANAVTFQDSADQPILEPALGETPLWNETKITGLFDAEISTLDTYNDILNLIQSNPTGNVNNTSIVRHKWEQLEDKDWIREWMESYHPIQCGEKLWICPSWKSPPDPQAVNVMLDPGLAFGTGTHPTTLLCLQWLAKQKVDALTVVDYGCGSGILAIAALLMDASFVNAIDIDPQALLATKDNAERNHISDESIDVFLPEQFNDGSEKKHDIVFANILAGPLVELAPILTALTKPGGKICLSGILDSQAQKVISAYEKDFEFEPISEQEHWVQLAASRRG
ncbi:MAG: 50S ribosomal protein L11 methyltransferase [Cellvibrionaceae bacterium]